MRKSMSIAKAAPRRRTNQRCTVVCAVGGAAAAAFGLHERRDGDEAHRRAELEARRHQKRVLVADVVDQIPSERRAAAPGEEVEALQRVPLRAVAGAHVVVQHRLGEPTGAVHQPRPHQVEADDEAGVLVGAVDGHEGERDEEADAEMVVEGGGAQHAARRLRMGLTAHLKGCTWLAHPHDHAW